MIEKKYIKKKKEKTNRRTKLIPDYPCLDIT